jgi:tetratricopeptide (TPR) repeat protein
MRGGPVVALAAIILCWTGEAGAQAPAAANAAAARAHYQKGLRQYEVGNYEEALAEFRAAHLAKADPAFIYNAAQCLRRLGRSSESLLLYRRFLSLSPDSPNRSEVEKRIRELEAQEASAERPAPPPHVAARTEELRETPPPQPALASPPPIPAPQEPAARLADGGPAHPAERRRWLPWTGVAVTVALAGGAAAYGLAARGRYNELKNGCGQTAAGCADADLRDISNRQLVTNVLIGLAAASAVATGIIFFVDGERGGVSVAHAF